MTEAVVKMLKEIADLSILKFDKECRWYFVKEIDQCNGLEKARKDFHLTSI